MPLIAKSDAPKKADPGPTKARQVAEWLTLLCQRAGAMAELRAVGMTRHGTDAVHTESCRYAADEPGLARMARDALAITPRAEAVYFTLNPLKPNGGHSAKDEDVWSRRWFLVDVDSRRPDADSCATDAEREASKAVALAIRNHLRAEGWPDPVFADSGNGWHLLYPIDLPADDTFTKQPDGAVAKVDGPASVLLRRCLRALGERFDTPGAKVDRVVYNASRICRLYGTLNRKGEDTPERPHRASALLETPTPLQPVMAELLEHLAAEAPAEETPKAKPMPKAKRKGLIARDRGPCPVDAYCQTALDAEIAALEGAPHGDRNNQLFRSAAALHQIVATGELDGHRVDAALADAARRIGLGEAEASKTIASARKAGASTPRDLADVGKRAERNGHAATATAPGPDGLDEATDDPHRLARLYLETTHTHPDGPTLRYWYEEWHQWSAERGAWSTVSDKEVHAGLVTAIKAEFDRIARGASRPPKPIGTRLVGNVAQALRSLVLLPVARVPDRPAWTDGDGPSPLECLSTRSGIVHLPAAFRGDVGALRPLSPRFFSANSLTYPYEPDPPWPRTWLDFLGTIWPDDPESIECLQEWFGYLLTADTRQQKILLIIGPLRSGKGTITRTLRALVGEANVAAPTLSKLASGEFGMQSLIGKTVCVCPESRLTGRADSQAIVERLLSISGEDPQCIGRKHLEDWHGTLRARFVLLGNELPRLGDYSGALPGRLIVLKLDQSFHGKEDLTLGERILAELPSILLWSIRGWHRLQERGRFAQPKAGQALLNEFEQLSNPIGAFVAERCLVGQHEDVAVQDLYKAWKQWCEENGRDHPGDVQGFARNLRTVLPRIETTQGTGNGRHRRFLGLRIKPSDDDAF